MISSRGKRQRALICIGLSACVLLVYAQAGSLEFIDYDDPDYVTENEIVREGLTTAGLVWAFTETHSYNWHPLTWLSHMTDVELFGMNPAGHHWVSVLLHLASTLLLFLVLAEMTGRVWPSALVAGLFAVHPLHVESVAWIAERKDVLSGLFWMLALLSYLGYSRNRDLRRYLVLLLVFAAGLMAKPMLVTLPFVLLLLDLWPLQRLSWGRPVGTAVPLLLEKIPLFLLSLVSSVVTFTVQRTAGSAKPWDVLPLGFRLENAAVSYVRYLFKAVWPAELGVFYPLPADIPSLQVAGSLLLLITVTVAVLLLVERSPWLAVGWLWFVGTLVPVIGIVQVGEQAYADRYTYIPYIGLSIAIVFGVAGIAESRPRAPGWLSVVAVLVLGAFCWQARNQTAYWKDSETLYRRTLEVTENNGVIHYNLGSTLLRENRVDEALEQLRAALRLLPGLEQARLNLGVALWTAGRLDAAVETFEELIRLNPEHAKAHNNLGIVLWNQGKPEAAVERFREAARLDPDYDEARRNLEDALARLGDGSRR